VSLVQRIAAQNPHLYHHDVENIVDAILGGVITAITCQSQAWLKERGT